MRNKFSFHYDDEQIKNAIKMTPDHEVFTLYIEEHYGNTFCSLYEILTTHYIIETMKIDKKTDPLKAFLEVVSKITHHFQNIIRNVIVLIIKRYLGEIDEIVKIPPHQKLTISIYHFF